MNKSGISYFPIVFLVTARITVYIFVVHLFSICHLIFEFGFLKICNVKKYLGV